MKNSVDGNISKRVVLLVATMSSFVAPFMMSSVNIALPSIGKEFALDAVLLSWVATSYTLAAAVFLVPFGRMADIYGRRRIFTLGILIFTLSSFVATFSPSTVILISLRVLQGIGSAMIFGTGVAILTSVFPLRERGRALGINVAAVYLGLSMGPFLGGILTQNFGWRSIFLSNVPLGLIITAAVLWKLRGEWAEAKGERFDLAGSLLYILAIIAIMSGLSLLPALSAAWVILAGFLGMLAFIKREIRVNSPVLNINLFRNNTVFALSNLATLINYSATFAVTFLLSLYLQYIKGLSPQSAGLILLTMPAVQTVLSPFAGRLSDRIEPRIVASTGMALATIGLVLLTFLSRNTAMELILVNLAIIGSGLALFASPNTNAIMSSVERRFYGVASGIVGTMRLTGQLLSMGIVMLIFTTYLGRVQITPEYYPVFVKSLKAAFVIFATLCFGGIFASFGRGKIR